VGANLHGAFLWCTDLKNADLRGANLSSACLWHANLTGAYLRGANLQNVDLRGVLIGDFEDTIGTPSYLPGEPLGKWGHALLASVQDLT
jgi:uncharacterized protein YjbI with pentapeptide repeats